LQRIRAGLSAAAQGNRRKLDLVFFELEGLSAKYPGRAGHEATHGLIKVGLQYFLRWRDSLYRNRAGLVALEVHGAAGKLELRIFLSWRDSLANSKWTWRGGTLGHRKVGSSYFHLGALLRRRSGQGCTLDLNRLGILELRIFSVEGSCKNSGRAARADHAGSRKVGA
jgi:hypothetical protein